MPLWLNCVRPYSCNEWFELLSRISEMRNTVETTRHGVAAPLRARQAPREVGGVINFLRAGNSTVRREFHGRRLPVRSCGKVFGAKPHSNRSLCIRSQA